MSAPEPSLTPRQRRLGALDSPRLLLVDEVRAEPGELAQVLEARDLLVINDAATLPASLPVMVFGTLPGELRLTAAPTRTAAGTAKIEAILFGAGTFRTPTEHRPPAPRVQSGSRVTVGKLTLRVTEVSAISRRYIKLESGVPFEDFVATLYRQGRVIQYAYMEQALDLWDAQTSFARVPFAVEAPSATYLLPHELPCEVVSLTHAAGISDTGDETLNAYLPFPERYAVPQRTVDAIQAARARGGRIIAVGTSVTRALETAARVTDAPSGDSLRAGAGTSDLRIDGNTVLRVVDGILTGVHDEHTSHWSLLAAFLPPGALQQAYERSQALGLHTHEFGDGWLLLPAESSTRGTFRPRS